MNMKYLLFDYTAISKYVQMRTLQSLEYEDGHKLIDLICGRGETCSFFDTVVFYSEEGVMFSGCNSSDKRIFCIDLTQCNILSEEKKPVDLLIIIQKIFRTCLRIWNKQPFSASERINRSKSIVFPFGVTDRRRVVIERSNNIERLTKRGIIQPLLAYKYNSDEPTQKEDEVLQDVLRKAGEKYISSYSSIISFLSLPTRSTNHSSEALAQIELETFKERSDFIYWDYSKQYESLTRCQKRIVDYPSISSPLRLEGAAGTGKTMSMLMRAYRILDEHRQSGEPIKLIYFTHSLSTCERNIELFSLFNSCQIFMSEDSNQTIQFTTLLDYCCMLSNYQKDELIEADALDAKTYGLMLIQSILVSDKISRKINTFFPLLSPNVKELFDRDINSTLTLSRILQHEFSIQIKGRANCALDEYKSLLSIANVIPNMTDRDKELVFCIFNEYQDQLKQMGNFDIDDVTIESLSILNAPRWRRERQTRGFDYIFVDEMHLFNFNEQNVFHLLSRSPAESVPICFALDYSQAIGDRGDKKDDYIERELHGAETQKYNTIFRNSPQISEFCRSIAASGTLMFESSFVNPYLQTQSGFTNYEESISSIPQLYMYKNDEDMLDSLRNHFDQMIKLLHCRNSDIAIISFDETYLEVNEVKKIEKIIGKKISFLKQDYGKQCDSTTISSPYDINGLEFSGVILLGADEGRIPQTTDVSDISKHFISYSAYNLLYLCSSRAKYSLLLLGNNTRGVSSCLQYSLSQKYIDIKNVD